jgi:TonB-linked SusC/RagA family outer membrane protein
VVTLRSGREFKERENVDTEALLPLSARIESAIPSIPTGESGMKIPLPRRDRRLAIPSLLYSSAALLVAGTSAFAQSMGAVRGTVTDAGGGAPVGQVQVYVIGTRHGTITQENGRFLITGVPAGQVTLRAQKLGYAPTQSSVTLAGNDTANVDFRLSSAALALDEVVVTGTPGATEKRVLGNTVSTVKADELTKDTPIPTVTELLQGRASGINVTSNSGSVGTSATIRIRGAGSLSANTQPVIYIDGIRMQAGVQRSFDNSGATVQATSALDAIDPNDIESMEVIKGPAAATLYGADAASGVIQIITKKGRMGQQSAEWNARAEYGGIDWALARPKTYWLCTTADTSKTLFPNCAALGSNIANHMLVDDPLNEPGALRSGNVATYGLSARGGAERYSYFFSFDHDGENGVLYNNFFRRDNGRANVQASLRDNLTLQMNVGYIRTNARQPLSDNSSNSIIRNAYRDRPSGPWPWQAEYRGLGPAIANQYDNEVATERYILGTSLNFQPFSWFQNRLNAGVDVNDQRSMVFYSIDTTGRQPWGATDANGWIGYILPNTHLWTVDYAGTATNNLPRQLTSAFSVGVQYSNSQLDSWQATGQTLVANQLNLVGSAAIRDADQIFIQQKSLGTYAQEQIGWRNRLFITGALRVDNNSAFGSNFKLVKYPKASVAYVISEEPFFHVPHLDQLKLRGAWGEAGNAPAPFTAVQAFAPTTTAIGDIQVNALQPQAYGNPNLRAETGSEVELGFDASGFGGRLGAEFTYYNKLTKDALVTVPAPPSSGYVGAGGGATGTYLANLGKIANNGLELTLNATPVQKRNFGWESAITLSTNHNKLVTFGTGFSEIRFGTFAINQKFQQGFPLGAYWYTDVVRDANGNPVLTDQNGNRALTGGKMTVDTALHYLGPSTPTREISLTNTFTIFKNFRLHSYFDYKGGGYLFDGIKYVNDRLDLNTWAVNNPNADPLTVQYLESGATRPDIVRSDFIKLRELSLAYTLPQVVAASARAKSATIQVSGRNLAIWKLHGYPGLDPEVEFFNAVGSNGQPATPTSLFDRTDYCSIPMTRRIMVSMNLTF